MTFGVGTSDFSYSWGSHGLEYDDKEGGTEMIPFSVSISTVVSG